MRLYVALVPAMFDDVLFYTECLCVQVYITRIETYVRNLGIVQVHAGVAMRGCGLPWWSREGGLA